MLRSLFELAIAFGVAFLIALSIGVLVKQNAFRTRTWQVRCTVLAAVLIGLSFLKGYRDISHQRALRVAAANAQEATTQFAEQLHTAQVHNQELQRQLAEQALNPDSEGIVELDPSQMWTATNIAVRGGQLLKVLATGQVTSTINQLDPAYKMAGPNGWGMEPSFMRNSYDLPLGHGSSFMCLIGRIGTAGDVFKLGADVQVPVYQTGILYLGVNDGLNPGQPNDDTFFRDNRGEFQASVQLLPLKKY